MSQNKDHKRAKTLTRRKLIEQGGKLGAGLAIAPFVLDLTACSGGGNASMASKPKTSASSKTGSTANKSTGSAGSSSSATSSASPASSGSPIETDSVLLGLYKGDGMTALKAAVGKLDFSWLGQGDTVLIKVASNSGVPHPATSSPNGVRAMAQELKARGAGKVIVADQAGVEWIRKTATGRYSSTMEQWKANGLAEVAADAELHFFDDQDWDSGYVMATPPDGHHWPRGLHIANIVTQVDHILYMPRIGAHTLAGLTLSQKCAIGWLRDDSRHDMHHDAQFFYEKYTEVNYTSEIHDKLRMVVTVAEKALLHGGPDMGTVHALDPVLVVASTSLPNHDAVASSLLVTLQKMVTPSGGGMTYTAAFAPLANSAFSNGTGVVGVQQAGPWTSGAPASSYTSHAFEQGVSKDRAIARGWELTGGKPTSIPLTLDGETIDPMLKSGLTTHGEGLYAFG